MRLVVVRPGMRSLVQDLGRPGFADLGIGAGGAWDRAAQALANRLVGNEPSAAVLEVLMGQLCLRAEDGDALVALSGAECPATVDGRPVDFFRPVLVRAGQQLELGLPVRGLRTIVAVRGGIDAPATFGSRSSDPTREIGPAALAAGDELAVGGQGGGTVVASDLAVTAGTPTGSLLLNATWGPRDDWFTEAARQLLLATDWTVTPNSDRVGTRLSGPPLERAVSGELASEAVVRGAVQVPTDGQPLVFGPDHPTTGGYPVIVVVDGADADRLSQARPGDLVRFRARRSSLDLDVG